MVLRMTNFQRYGFRLRRHLLRLAVLTLAILSFASAIAHEESPVSLNDVQRREKRCEINALIDQNGFGVTPGVTRTRLSCA